MARSMRMLTVAIVLLSLPLLMAMGGGNSEGPTRIPEPAANYRVVLTDLDGTVVELTEFSIEGMDFVTGNLGQGELAVPFAKVREVVIRNLEGKLKAQVKLDDGKSVEMVANPRLYATGKTGYGNFRIPLGEVSRIQVKGLVR